MIHAFIVILNQSFDAHTLSRQIYLISKCKCSIILFDLSIFKIRKTSVKCLKCCKICTLHWNSVSLTLSGCPRPYVLQTLIRFSFEMNWYILKLWFFWRRKFYFFLAASVWYNLLLVKAMYSMHSRVSLWRVRFDKKGGTLAFTDGSTNHYPSHALTKKEGHTHRWIHKSLSSRVVEKGHFSICRWIHKSRWIS